jgi:Crp-like helix-turn-helix domain
MSGKLELPLDPEAFLSDAGQGNFKIHLRRRQGYFFAGRSSRFNLLHHKAVMIRALHDESEFCEMFMSHLLARNIRVEVDLERKASSSDASYPGEFWQG